MLRSLRRAFGRRARGPRWRVAIRAGATPLIEDPSPQALAGFRALEPPPGIFWADPFLFRHPTGLWLFFEACPEGALAGRIECAPVDADGRVGRARPALEAPHHLSYPVVFEDAGEVYLLPESHRAGGLDLYRALEFPVRWERAWRLLEGPFVDVTPLRHAGAWWLFATPLAARASEEALHLYRAEGLRGPWRAHPANPIARGALGGRGAGRILADGGRLIRPVQDGRAGYGSGLEFRLIERLDEGGYAESPLAAIAPAAVPGAVGLHAYDRVDAVEVIDLRFA